MNKLICALLIVAFLTVTMPPCAYGVNNEEKWNACKLFHFPLSVDVLSVCSTPKKWPNESVYVMSYGTQSTLYTFIINYMVVLYWYRPWRSFEKSQIFAKRRAIKSSHLSL